MIIWFFITNLRGGGAERAAINFSRGLSDRGHTVKLILLEDRVEYAIPSSVALQFIGARKRSISKGWLGKRIAAWRLRRWVSRQPSSERPDLVISTLPFTDEVVRAAGLEDVWFRITNTLSAEIAWLEALSPAKARRRLVRYRRLYDGVNIIAVSEGVAADLRQRLNIQSAKTAVIYNPFKIDEMRQRATLPDPDLPGERYVIHAGRFERQKRHDLLLDAYAASKIPHRLVLLTKSSRALRELIAGRGLTDRVTITGFRRNPFPWYANASALVLSSDFEGFPNVLVEALACGTPVVSTDCPSGPNEILTGPLKRFLSPCGDAEALARNLASIVEAPPTIGPAMVERFSPNAAFNAIESLARRT
jgi:glycosyltransferase involved in cell wall biosynthesis